MHTCPRCSVDTDLAIRVKWMGRSEEFWCLACIYEYGQKLTMHRQNNTS